MLFRSRRNQIEDKNDFDIRDLEDIDGLVDLMARKRKYPRNLDLDRRIPRV